MTRNFKISFPLPRRPSASPNATPGSQYSNKKNIDDSPFSHPGAKAERTLGASEPEAAESKKKKRQLRNGFMSVTLADVDGESTQTPDEYPFPGMQTPAESSRGPSYFLNRQGSSPLLGEQYANGSTEADYFNRLPSPQARRAGSAMTLRAHYDPARSPLAISQQTSASSARDMALRKGCPEVSRPATHHSVQAVKSNDPSRPHSRSPSADSRISGSSIKKITAIPRRRPSVTDPPTLYPYADRAFHAVSPPPALINSTLPKPLPTQQTASSSGSKWWQRKAASKTPPPSSPIGRQTHQQPFEQNFSSIKVNVRRPKPGTPGDRNWFDGLEDDEPIIADLQHPELSTRQTRQKQEPPLSISEIMSLEPRGTEITSRKSSFSNKSQHTATMTRKLSFRLDSSSPPSRPLHAGVSTPMGDIHSGSSPTLSQPPHTTSSSPSNTIRNALKSPSNDSIQSTINGRVMHAGMNLQLESFLELSSSEDEGGESSATFEIQPSYRRHKIRASIEKASYDSEVSVGNAQRAKPVRPRSIVNRNTNRPNAAIANSSEIVPPVPSIPGKPQPGPRTSSTRWREIMEDKALSTESTIDSRESSVNGDIHARITQSRRPQRNPSLRGSKMMKVTQEEEKLLEAMREKRASIRQDDFEKGFKTAMQLHEIVSRPKTAGADGRTSRSSTSIYGSRSSNSPPPQEYGIKRILAGSRLSASTDDLITEDSYPFPEVPLSLKNPLGFASPSKTSPSLSFSPSDILPVSDTLPETPTSRNSPITPTAGHGQLSTYSRSGISPPRGTTVTSKAGHERKRTSGSVVILDGMEQHAQELDEENAITGWAMDRW
ncbi:hypothetical protein JMJ35_003786 [Cladonia borealis]|uniref:Uncharacterized protein n=1 Tax=Cladonia borealis TaxID=184061 RepID=A0AA39V6F3_9LECA|nr:hypothetical protein JMJ35_003786 [Cladonia borealis]